MSDDRRARTQYTICDDCGNSTLEHEKAVWTTDGASYCPTCRPMTSDRRAALVERVARALCADAYSHIDMKMVDTFSPDRDYWERQATAAIDLIRAEVLEEAARAADSHTVSPDPVGVIKAMAIAAAIRTRKEKP